MLKLEQKETGLSIGLRDKEKWLSGPLLAALFIALVFHFAAFVLFDIQSFRLKHSRFVPPAVVETDLNTVEDEPKITVEWEEEKKGRRDHLMPIASTPKFEINHLPDYEQPAIAPPAVSDHPFASTEKWGRLNLDAEPTMMNNVSIHLSGGLGGRSLNPMAIALSNQGSSHFHCVAEVQVDEMTGEVFWWEEVMMEGEMSLRAEAEKILAQMSVKPLKRNGISRGLVDIILVNR